MGLIFNLMSCNRLVTKEQLVGFVNNEDNNLKFNGRIRDVKYQVLFKPHDLIYLNEMEKDKLASSNARKSHEDEFIYFILQASKNDKDLFYSSNEDYDYNELLTKFSFQLKEYVYGVYDNTDTVSIAEYAFTRNYATTNATSAMVAFRKRKDYRTFNILVKDIVYGAYGVLEFKYDSEDINKVPKLNIDKYAI
jgi:hypothetical protein